MTTLKYWLWLTSRRGMDAVGALKVLDHFVTPERAYAADPEEYDLLPISPAARAALTDKGLDRAAETVGDCERLGLRPRPSRLLTTPSACRPSPFRRWCCTAGARCSILTRK